MKRTVYLSSNEDRFEINEDVFVFVGDVGELFNNNLLRFPPPVDAVCESPLIK